MDHPRACGVYIPRTLISVIRRGSSPRVRGLPDSLARARINNRIIPARAGFTSCRILMMVRMADHPRACGVYSTITRERLTRGGSSPRVRGLRQIPRPLKRVNRIIPARAGFTLCLRRRYRLDTDHPRACGVYPRAIMQMLLPGGSSPRVRGLHENLLPILALFRIIPARAGFTCSWSFLEKRIRDHPRACGVYPTHHLRNHGQRGSSPRVRGLPNKRIRATTQVRIIPARAGFTRPRRQSGRYREDHPRACGVYSFTVTG